MKTEKLRAVNRKNVSISGGLFRERMELNRRYLKELDTTCLLQNFYLEAGIGLPGIQTIYEPEDVKLHWGWEAPVCQLRGHFLGHWMSAAARLTASEKDEELRIKLDTIVSELARCQKRNGGEWVGPIPEKYLDLLSESEYIWSPQYTVHKVVMGLTDAYRFTGNKQALDIVGHLADWFIKWAERMKEKDPRITYKGEQGGMLEMWAQLYELTGEKKYKTLIGLYKDSGLYTQLENRSEDKSDGKDGLSDDHANASIPLSHGAAKMYEITGDEYWSRITDTFWRSAVTDRGMYATTGSNAGEFWIPLRSHGEYISDRDQEFCTVYNMVRTADYLLRKTGDVQYADYIERALYNGFLAQQNKETGMPAYFLPLNPGAKKKWGSKTRDFWCCHGTMVQAQTLYPELIYYVDENDHSHDPYDKRRKSAHKIMVESDETMKDPVSLFKVAIMQYIPSCAKFEIGGNEVTIQQATEMKNYDNQVFFDDHKGGEKSRWSLKFTIHSTETCEFTLSLRVPVWCRNVKNFVINEETVEPETEGGFINITRKWSDDTIYLTFVDEIVMERLLDMQKLAAAVEGPIVLAGLIEHDCSLKGDYDSPQDIFAPRSEHTYSTYTWKQNCHTTKDQGVNFDFVPLYEVTDESYTVYFTEKKE